MDRPQFTFYRSYWEAIKGLPQKERESALEAIIEYALNETEPEKLSPIANAVFVLIKPTVDTGRNKAANRLNKIKSNG